MSIYPNNNEDYVNKERVRKLAAIAAAMRDLLSCFKDSNPSTECNVFECSAMRTGALSNELENKGLDLEKIERAADGYSVDEVFMALRCFRQPKVFLRTGWMHVCSHDTALASTVEKIGSELQLTK